MCVGVERRHRQCGHLKSFVIRIRCANAERTGDDCRKSQCSLVEGETDFLPLCLVCYRKEEKEMCEMADEVINETTELISRIKEQLENPDLNLTERGRLTNLLTRNENLQVENRRARALALSHFRNSQGVWGDG